LARPPLSIKLDDWLFFKKSILKHFYKNVVVVVDFDVTKPNLKAFRGLKNESSKYFIRANFFEALTKILDEFEA